MPNTFEALLDLERRYDGPIPEDARLIARHGSAEAVRLLYATGAVAFWESQLAGQVKAISMRQADGSFYPAMTDDLNFYGDQLAKARAELNSAQDAHFDMECEKAIEGLGL